MINQYITNLGRFLLVLITSVSFGVWQNNFAAFMFLFFAIQVVAVLAWRES